MASIQWRKVQVVAITTMLSALDGYDLLAISFASPGIAAEWHVDRGTLGVVLSMELVGMALGSIFLGLLADRLGRRPIIVTCLTLMSLGMFMVTFANGITDLSAWRLLTGIGIGGMLSTISTAAAEYASDNHRDRAVSLMAIGYPLGVIVGGALCAVLLRNHDWRWVFYVGGTVTVICIPLVLLRLPESVRWLAQRGLPDALARINHALGLLGQPSVAAIPRSAAGATYAQAPKIFSRGLWAFTVLSTLAYAFHVFSWFYVLKWLPTIVVGMGFSVPAAIGVLVWVNVGAVVGALALGTFAKHWGLQRLTAGAMLVSALAVVCMGRMPRDLASLSWICGAAGMCITAGIIGIYATLAKGFPTALRASGTGFCMGVGRIGSAVAPISAGFLFRQGYDVATVSAIMASGALVAAALIGVLRFPAHTAEAQGLIE